MNWFQRLALWVFKTEWIPLGPIPPQHLLGFALGSGAQRVPVLVLEVRACTDRGTKGFGHLLPELREQGRCNSPHGASCCVCEGPLPDIHWHLNAECHDCPTHGVKMWGHGGNACSGDCAGAFARWLENEPPRTSICPEHWGGSKVFGSYGRHQRHSVKVQRVPAA